MITVIDLDVGNLQSVCHAFKRVGAQTTIARTPEEVNEADIIVLPGVGAFERAMSRLNERNFAPNLRQRVLEQRVPIVGICLGMQLLAERSHEHGVCAGLGLIRGEVVTLRAPVRAAKPSPMFPAGVDGESFYHVHSYHLVCADATDVAATIDYAGDPIVTAVERQNIFGVQFHPEKSQDAGLNLLSSLLGHLDNARRTPR